MAQKSKCCNSKVKVVGRTTLHYECIKCHNPCDIFYTERKTWEINPRTRVVPNKKKRLTKLTPRELKRIKQEEDF